MERHIPRKSGYKQQGCVQVKAMTGKADDHKEVEKPKESHPAPETSQKGAIGDAAKHAEWKATQRERIRAQEHSATDLLQDKENPQPKTSRFELVDNAGNRPGWMEVGHKLAALPFQTQAQIIGTGLMAGIEQYTNEQQRIEF